MNIGVFFKRAQREEKSRKENGFSMMSESGMRHNFMENTHLTLFFYDFLEHINLSKRWDVRKFIFLVLFFQFEFSHIYYVNVIFTAICID